MEHAKFTQLEHPTDDQIEEMTLLAVEAFETTIMDRTMTSGVREYQEAFHRFIFRAAALEGKIYTRTVDSGKIVSVGAGFGPVTKFLGSDAQRSLGFDELFEKLPEDTKDWWRTNLLKPNQEPVNEKVQQSLKLVTVATVSEERRKGHGSFLITAITKAVGTSVTVNANTAANVEFYKRLGFKIVSTLKMNSSYGSWVRTTMLWEEED